MKAANSKAMRSAEDKVFKNIWSSVYPTPRNSDYTKIVNAVRQGANAPGKLPLDKAATELVPWVEDVTVEIEGDGDAFLFSDSDILDIAYGVAERLLDELRKKGVIPVKGMREGKVPAKKADDESEDTTESAGKSFKDFRKQLEEQVYMDETDSRMYGDDSVLKPSKGKPKPCKGKDCDKPKPFKGYEETEQEPTGLDEGAVKAAMEDWMYSLPKPLVAEINRKYAGKLKAAAITGLSKGDPIRKALIALLDKYKVAPALGDTSRDFDISALETMFDSFFGESVEAFKGYKETELDEGGVKDALADYMYSLPQAAIEELKPIMKQKASTKKFGQITKILKKHGFTAMFMGSYPANVVNDYFDTFFGEVTTEETANFIEAKQQLFTGPGKKDSKRLIGVYSKSGKWIKDMSSEAEARKYVEKTQKESVQDTHLDEAFKIKKVGVSPDGKPVYSMNNKYYVVSYSVMARETAIFASDSKGNVSNYNDLWMGSGFVSPDTAMKELEKSLTK
jgi:hypothetical protein